MKTGIIGFILIFAWYLWPQGTQELSVGAPSERQCFTINTAWEDDPICGASEEMLDDCKNLVPAALYRLTHAIDQRVKPPKSIHGRSYLENDTMCIDDIPVRVKDSLKDKVSDKVLQSVKDILNEQ